MFCFKEEIEPIHYATLAGQLEIIQLLIENYEVPPDAATKVNTS